MYTLILMSSRKNSVRQHTFHRGYVLFFFSIILFLCIGAIGGLNYGISQQQQRTHSKEKTQLDAEKKIEQITQEKRQVELELIEVNEEMKSIRRMAAQIQEALGILGQGGGNSPEGAEGFVDTQQETISMMAGTSETTEEKEETLTINSLKHEIQHLHAHVNEHQKRFDEYPSILPVKLQQEGAKKQVYWYSSQFGWRTHPLTKKREFHQGLDIKTQSGVPVIAAAAGTVVKAKTNGYLGKTIEIEHEVRLLKTVYAHLKDYAAGLKVGQKVTRGQIIGYVGNTGRSTGAHLHYGIYDIEKERWVNPIKYIFDQQPTFSP